MSDIPIDEAKERPPEIENALAALETLRDEDPEGAEEVKKALPAFARKLAKAGEETSYESLLAYARQGKAHLDNILIHHDERKKPKRNYETIVRHLPAPEAESETLNEWMFRAAREADLNAVRQAVTAGADIRANDDEMIQIAARNGDPAMVEYCHARGCDIRAGRVHQGSRDVVLYNAVAQNNVAILDYWWRHVEGDYQDSLNHTLVEAAFYDHFDLVQALRNDYGADINASTDLHACDFICEAVALAGAVNNSQEILDYGMSFINDEDNRKKALENAFRTAINCKHYDMARYLYTHYKVQYIENGDDNHFVIMVHAAANNRQDVVDFWRNIIELVGDEDHNNLVLDQMIRAAANGGHLDMVRELYARLASRLDENENSELPVHIFAAGLIHRDNAMVRFAHDKGADITVYDNGALAYTAKNNDITNFAYCYENGAFCA